MVLDAELSKKFRCFIEFEQFFMIDTMTASCVHLVLVDQESVYGCIVLFCVAQVIRLAIIASPTDVIRLVAATLKSKS